MTQIIFYIDLCQCEKHKLKSRFDGIVLDIIHVSEYVWEAATAIYGEKSKFRRPWVKRVLQELLESNTEEVIEELEQHRGKTNLYFERDKKVILKSFFPVQRVYR